MQNLILCTVYILQLQNHQSWRDMNLKIEMENYVQEGLQRSEILSFLERNFQMEHSFSG
jgi:hypothetical protein